MFYYQWHKERQAETNYNHHVLSHMTEQRKSEALSYHKLDICALNLSSRDN